MRSNRSGYHPSGDLFRSAPAPAPRDPGRTPVAGRPIQVKGRAFTDAERVQKWLCENPPATPPQGICGQCGAEIFDYSRAAPFLHPVGKLWIHRKCIASFFEARDNAARVALGLGTK